MKIITRLVAMCLFFDALTGCVVAPAPYYQPIYYRPVPPVVYYSNRPVPYYNYPYYPSPYYNGYYYPYNYPYVYPSATVSVGYYGGWGWRHHGHRWR